MERLCNQDPLRSDRNAAGLAGFVQADQDFGEVEGFTARVGLRYAW